MTTRDQELQQQRRWKLKAQFASVRTFDQLLENEFRSRAQHRAWEKRAVNSIVRFASLHTPYYAKLFKRLGVRAEEIDDPEALAKLPHPFGDIAGRYRSFAGLPSGTRERFRAIRHAVESYPLRELAFLRGYQVHQDRENRFTLRVRAVTPIPDAVRQSVIRA